jgi:hypothetical protein
LPSPIQQAIETTQSSLARGDWGLKRPLPSRGIKARTAPTIRIANIDSIDHITDFESANDHALTLRKWQEMNIPITALLAPNRASEPTKAGGVRSVFEENQDFTTDDASNSSRSARWKFQGPWLGGQSHGEFDDYVKRKVKKRKAEFRQHLRLQMIEYRNREALMRAREDGTELPVPRTDISDEEFDEELIRLRNDPTALWPLMWKFLDLPESSPEQHARATGSYSTNSSATHAADSMVFEMGSSAAIDRGPPTTHPSAGLSYLRTGAYISNHPILGPMKEKKPVEARVIQQVGGGRNFEQRNKLMAGVGGVIASRPGNVFKDDSTMIDTDTVGGPKLWVHPIQASIDPKGRIRLIVEPAHKDTLAVWEGKVDSSVLQAYERDQATKNAPRQVPDLIKDFNTPGRGEFHGRGVSMQNTEADLKNILSETLQQ